MLDLEFVYSPWYIPLCMLIAAGLAGWMYNQLPQDISKNLKMFLRTLRFFSLFFILLLLLEPLVSTVTEVVYPPIVVFLQDGSESMTAHKDSAFFNKEYPKLYNEFEAKLKKGGAAMHSFQFGNEFTALNSIDSLNYRYSGTNISKTLEELSAQYSNQNVAAYVLVSDGIPTAGTNPLYKTDKISLPIFTAVCGDTTDQKDVVLESVMYNEISYLNTETPFAVKIQGNRYAGSSVDVSLSQAGKVLGKQKVTFNSDGDEKTVNFTHLLKQIGIQQFEIDVTELNGEASYRNNHKKLFINVLESRIRIALFAGAPHPDIAALKQCFQRDARYQFSTFIRKSNSEFYNFPEKISDYDVFILHNFPSVGADKEILNQIYEQVSARKTPILHIAGTGLLMNVHPEQKNFMCLYPEGYVQNYADAQMLLSPDYKTHVTYTFDNKFDNWVQTAPPLLRNNSDWKSTANTTVAAKAVIKNIKLDYPMMGLGEIKGAKNIVITGENIWRYRMHNYLETSNFEYFDTWFQNLIQWITTKEDKRKFRVFPEKSLFSSDEKIIIKGQIYDDTYKPLKECEVKFTLISPAKTKTDYYLNELEQGGYYLEINNLEEGTYNFEAIGKKEGKTIGTDRGQFSVGKSAIEFVQLKSDVVMMQQLANRTNGKAFTINQMNAMADEILKLPNLKPQVEYKKATQSLNKYWWWLVLILTLLGTEWVVRKRNGLL